jgi:glycosyltransferase involved in cell wall biosynthesis
MDINRVGVRSQLNIMRILMVTSQLPTSNKPRTLAFVARQIQSIRDIGLQVELLEIKGVSQLKYLVGISQLWRLLKKADIIHAHYSYCGWLARIQCSLPIAMSFMGDDLLGSPGNDGRATIRSRIEVQINRCFAHFVDAIIVKSEEMARIVAPLKAYIVPNGVDLNAFFPIEIEQARRELGLTLRKKYVLFPGDPDNPRKGFNLAQAAIHIARLHFSEPIEIITLRNIIPERVPLYFNACDAVLMTSLWEGSPNVIKEAMACNVPIISVPVGDVPQLLENVSVSEVCPRDPEEIGRALARILKCGRRSNGRDSIIIKKLDQVTVAHRIHGIYKEVLSGQRKRSDN